jgi:hypothetical protein
MASILLSLLKSTNPWWQTDYANVHFTFVPNGNQPYADRKVFVVGEMNKYNTDDTSAMTYNATEGVYEKNIVPENRILLLHICNQGYADTQ